jgi:hypothetical protein
MWRLPSFSRGVQRSIGISCFNSTRGRKIWFISLLFSFSSSCSDSFPFHLLVGVIKVVPPSTWSDALAFYSVCKLTLRSGNTNSISTRHNLNFTQNLSVSTHFNNATTSPVGFWFSASFLFLRTDVLTWTEEQTQARKKVPPFFSCSSLPLLFFVAVKGWALVRWYSLL